MNIVSFVGQKQEWNKVLFCCLGQRADKTILLVKEIKNKCLNEEKLKMFRRSTVNVDQRSHVSAVTINRHE